MSDIQELLGGLAESKITPAVLNGLDFVVPGEWTNATSLEQVIEASLGVTEPAEVEAIKARALELYAAQPHYSRAVKIFAAADTVDKVAAAAVAANQLGETFEVFKILDSFTPKAETTQAVDAALKLTAEIVAFATLRGIPVTSLNEAKAFPATLATYAKADLIRLSAWMTLDGLLPLGPEFFGKIKEIISGIDTSALTDNALFAQLKDLLPGEDAEGQKGFILSSLDNASTWVNEFIAARGITREDISGKMGTLVNVAESGADVLAATIDATTNYFEHTGIQSVARVLVHDAQEALSEGEAAPEPVAEGEEATEEGSGWFKKAAGVAVGTAAGVAVGSMLFRGRSDTETEEEGGSETDLADIDDDPVDVADDDIDDDDGLLDLDDNAFAAREAALEMKARQLARKEARLDAKADRQAERAERQEARADRQVARAERQQRRRELIKERKQLKRAKGKRRGRGKGRRG